jgi:hypothetical protein
MLDVEVGRGKRKGAGEDDEEGWRGGSMEEEQELGGALDSGLNGGRGLGMCGGGDWWRHT